MNPVRVIAFEWNTLMLINVLVALKEKYGWKPIYCVSHNLEAYVKERLPDIIYHDTFDARYGRPAAALAHMRLNVLDEPAAAALSTSQLLALKQMDRMELLGGFAQRDRFIHFHRLAGYWNAVLDELKPDVILMPTSPHVVYDLVGYSLAKLRGVRTILFEYVTTEGLLMAIDGFENGLPPLVSKFQIGGLSSPVPDVSLSPRLEDYWKRLRGEYVKAVPSYTRELWVDAETIENEAARKEAIRNQERLARSKAYHSRKLSHRFKLAAAALGTRKRMRPVDQNSKEKPPSTDGHYLGKFYKASEVPEFIARQAVSFRRKNAENSRRRYDELAVKPDLTQPYVYVALHIQPERSTNPNGRVFDDQQVLVGLIAKSLPRGWKIYVKEHPSQFVPQYASERGRSPSFYDALVDYPHIQLVDRKTPSFDLIDNARAVATITGTSSWEALVRGIPTLVFGEAWYKGCPGAYDVRSSEDCRNALAEIAAGNRPDPKAVRFFLKTAEELSFIGYLSADDQPSAGIDEATNVTRLAEAIASQFRGS
jgi:hypothetical protein